jgi:hypothetical protein
MYICFLYNSQDFYLTISNIKRSYADGLIDYCSDSEINVPVFATT